MRKMKFISFYITSELFPGLSLGGNLGEIITLGAEISP